MDEKTVLKAMKGEKEAFEEIMRYWEPRIYGFALKHLGNVDDARDITQEVLFLVYRKIHQLRKPEAFSSWIYSIAMNEIRKLWKKRGEEKIEITLPIEVPKRKGYAFLALQMISPEQREVILLKEIEGFSIKEIARILNIPEGTVKSRLFYGLKALRREYLRLKEESYERIQ